MKQTFQIATPSLAQFTEEIVRMTKDGWELDNENVAHTAHNYGNLYAVILVKPETNIVSLVLDVNNLPTMTPEALHELDKRAVDYSEVPELTNEFWSVVKQEGDTYVSDASDEVAVTEQPPQQTKRVPPRRKTAE